MSLSARIARVDVNDPDRTATMPVASTVTYEITTDDAEAVAAGMGSRVISLRCEIARADIPALQAALGAALRVVDDGAWPTNAIPLPLPKKAAP